jgi:hypothetical protein
VVVAVVDKNSNENYSKPTETLMPLEPIHHHILPPNEPHPCDKYGCHEKPNTNSETIISATTKQLVTLEKSQKDAEKEALS